MDSIRSRLLLDSLDFTPASISGLVAWYDTSLPAYLISNPVGAAPGSGVSVLYNRAVSSRTGNLLVQSEDFSTTWARVAVNAFGATDTGAAGAGSFANTARTTDPLGGNTADFIQEDGTASANHDVNQAAVSFTAGSTYSFSVFAKKDSRYGLAVSFPATAFTSQQIGKFNLNTGTGAVRTGTPTVTIADAGNGWYLCKITATATTTVAGTPVLYISSDDGSTVIYNGDNTSGLFLWGASLVRSDMTPVTGPTLAQGYYRTTTVSHDPIHDAVQATAASQGQLSRRDRKGNWLKQSSDFSTTWARGRLNAFGATDTGALGAGSFANTARTTDPLGGSTADFIQEDGTAGNSHFLYQTLTIPPGTYTYTKWIKAAGRTKVALYFSTIGVARGFDLSNGTSFTVSGVTDAPGYGIVESPVGSGWYRCSITATTASTITADARVYIIETNAFSYNGDNTSGLFLWGASLVESNWDPVTGPTEAQGYVATTTQAAFPGQNGLQILRADGSDDYWKTLQFQLAQPTTVVWFGRQVTWTSGDRVVNGYAASSTEIYQTSASPRLVMYSGSVGPYLDTITLGQMGCVVGVFNGASSVMRFNNQTPATGNVGSNDANGLTLCSVGGTPGSYANTDIGEVCIFNRALDASEIGKLVSYGAKKWGFTA